MPERLRAWVLAMRWHDLLFAHWPIPAERLRALVPPQLELDTFGGSAWLGIVPFRMSHVRARGLPPLPGASAFPELNVRTYVHRRGHAGVWFFSLDASHRLAVRTARALFALPYFDADMRCARAADGSIEYACRRTHRGAPAAAFAARYGPIGEVAHAEPGSLAHFLTARFCLFTAGGRGEVRRCDIAHAPVAAAAGAMGAAGVRHDEAPRHRAARVPTDPPLRAARGRARGMAAARTTVSAARPRPTRRGAAKYDRPDVEASLG